MAQIKIRKYNPGGVLTTETGDTFTLEEVEQLVRENPTNENLKDIANELRAGKDVQHNLSDNWSSVTDDDFRAGQKRRIAKDPNSFARRLAATFNTQVHQYGEDVNDTTAVLSAAARNKAATNGAGAETGSGAGSGSGTGASDYTLISSGGGARFIYDPETGAYVDGDFTNAKLMSLLTNLDAYLSNDDSDTKYKFKGLASDVRNVLKEMYATNPNMIKELQQKILNGQIVEGSPEASLLLQLGIGSNVTKDELEQSRKDKALKDYFIGKGFSEDQFKDFLPYIELDGQGLRLKDGVEGSPFMAGQNYYFNDDYNGPFKDLIKGQILFNNRFYNADQLANSGMISDWVKALREHRFTDADSMIRWDWKGVSGNYDYQLFDNQKYYNDFLNGKRYLDVTGQYEKTYDDNGNEYQIMGYYDPNDQNNYTPLGFVDPSKIKYARFDSMGNLVDENYNIAFLRKAMSPWQHTSIFQERRDNGQVVIPSVVTRKGRGILGMDVTFDPDKGTVQFHGASVRDVLGEGNGDAIELDGEIAQILSPEFFANLENVDKNNLDKFKDTILSLVGNKFGNLYVRNQLSRNEWADVLRPTYGEDAEMYADILFNYFKEYIGNTSGFRKTMDHMAGFGAFRKQVGRNARIHEFTPKHQHGGLFTGSTVAASSAPKIVQSDNYVPATTEEAGAFQFNEFTDADWFELAGLGADLASVVTGVTGFTPASVATGLAGTGSSFMADIRRDGFQMKDLGNLGLGLLFDAASIVPGLGVAASTGQVMRTIKKGLPVLMKLAGIAGVGSSLSLAVNKIRSGEELTMKDLRIIMNGVLGTYTLAKQGVDVTNSRKKDGVKFDADIEKIHMDQIDASNLSDGQKAAMKRYFDGKDYSAGLSSEQKAIYDQFIADGGDEIALKMALGEDNDTFKAIRRQREILQKASDSLKPGGRPLTPEENAEYSKILDEVNIRKYMTPEEYAKLQDPTSDHADIADLIRKYEATGDSMYMDQLDGYAASNPEYKRIIDKYKGFAKESEYSRLKNEINNSSDEYHAGMFSKRNNHYTGMDEAGAAAVKNNDVAADTIDGRIAEANKALEIATKNAKKTKAYKSAKTDVEKLRVIKSKTDAQRRAVNALNAEKEGLKRSGVLVYDKNTKTWVKSAEHIQKMNDVKAQFIETGKTRSKLLEDFRSKYGSDPDGVTTQSADSYEASFKAQREQDINDLITNELPSTKRSGDVMQYDNVYSNLTPDERKIVADILNKRVGYDELSADDIKTLNYYTQKAKGLDVVDDADIQKAWFGTKQNASDQDAFKNFKLADDVGIDTVNALLRKNNLSKSKTIKISETDWAKIKKQDDPGLALMAWLKKKGYSDTDAERIMRSVTTEVEKPVESERRTWFGRKKKSSTSTSTSTEPRFDLELDKFKTRYQDDNTLKGKILGRSTEQRKYAENLYGTNKKKTDWKMPYRYYQPMVHGLHYNLMRDPIHHTPWYEPKEITIQLENEEEE